MTGAGLALSSPEEVGSQAKASVPSKPAPVRTPQARRIMDMGWLPPNKKPIEHVESESGRFSHRLRSAGKVNRPCQDERQTRKDGLLSGNPQREPPEACALQPARPLRSRSRSAGGACPNGQRRIADKGLTHFCSSREGVLPKTPHASHRSGFPGSSAGRSNPCYTVPESLPSGVLAMPPSSRPPRPLARGGERPVRRQTRTFRPNYLSFAGTYQCNLTCPHCCVPIEWTDRLDIGVALRFLEDAHAYGIGILGFTGRRAVPVSRVRAHAVPPGGRAGLPLRQDHDQRRLVPGPAPPGGGAARAGGSRLYAASWG